MFGICGGWCCGLSKEHLEAFIYWAIMCWASRSKAGRADISYRKYRPLRPDAVTQEEDAAAEARQHAQDLQDREAGDRDPAWLAARRAAEAKKEAATAAAAVAQGSSHGANAEHTTPEGKKKPAKKPLKRKGNAAAAAKASLELAHTRHVLHRREAHGDSDSDSTDSSEEEVEFMLQSAPADKGVEKGTWLAATKWYGFGR